MSIFDRYRWSDFFGEIGRRFNAVAGWESGRARVPAGREDLPKTEGCIFVRDYNNPFGSVNDGSRGRDPSRAMGSS
jgi:hypothetical protein